MIYNALTTSYTLPCPRHGETRIRLSFFRRLEELPGTHHPTVFCVDYACRCGDEHASLVPHDELDWAPLGVRDPTAFVNLMTSRLEPVADEFSDLAAAHIKAGEWPWSFFCLGEGRPRVVFPSAFRLIAPAPGGRIGIAVQCPVCGTVSVNLVSRDHVDVPFVNDREVGVAGHVISLDAALQVDEFRAQLASDAFDARRLELE